ncbi:MAG: hypothetical protein IJZ20_03740, partial [Clostridia bacterium]|nr:hypothetical protein [Clostridia bacterium]
KSIKRLMTCSDYADKDRYFVPFVCMDERIILVPGVAVSDALRQSTERTQKVSITLYRTT